MPSEETEAETRVTLALIRWCMILRCNRRCVATTASRLRDFDHRGSTRWLMAQDTFSSRFRSEPEAEANMYHRQVSPGVHHQPLVYQPPSPLSTPLNTPQHTTIVHSSIKPMPDSDMYKVGIYGWRKRCLYVFILVLTIVIVVNLAMTVWIMIVLDFSLDGIGAFKVESDGIKVEGRSEFDKPVQFTQLSVDDNTEASSAALRIESPLGVTLSAHNFSGYSTASLELASGGQAQAVCDRFEVLDINRRPLFVVDSHEIGLKLENLRILDDGGSVFEGAIQTAIIRPEPDNSLSLESPTRSLNIDAAQDVELMSGAGEIQLNSLLDIHLKSKQGDVHIDSDNVYMSGLERSAGHGRAQYQLCVCQNGRLFTAVERSDCRADRTICG